jgi:hypothetical protein
MSALWMVFEGNGFATVAMPVKFKTSDTINKMAQQSLLLYV